jgi:hypothetical protein
MGRTPGSPVSYAMGYGSGRSFLFRYGPYLLIRPRDPEAADR